MKITLTERFVILTILQVEKHWAKVRNSAIAYSPMISTCLRIQTFPHHEITTLHEVTTVQGSLPI